MLTKTATPAAVEDGQPKECAVGERKMRKSRLEFIFIAMHPLDAHDSRTVRRVCDFRSLPPHLATRAKQHSSRKLAKIAKQVMQ